MLDIHYENQAISHEPKYPAQETSSISLPRTTVAKNVTASSDSPNPGTVQPWHCITLNPFMVAPRSANFK